MCDKQDKCKSQSNIINMININNNNNETKIYNYLNQLDKTEDKNVKEFCLSHGFVAILVFVLVLLIVLIFIVYHSLLVI